MSTLSAKGYVVTYRFLRSQMAMNVKRSITSSIRLGVGPKEHAYFKRYQIVLERVNTFDLCVQKSGMLKEELEIYAKLPGGNGHAKFPNAVKRKIMQFVFDPVDMLNIIPSANRAACAARAQYHYTRAIILAHSITLTDELFNVCDPGAAFVLDASSRVRMKASMPFGIFIKDANGKMVDAQMMTESWTCDSDMGFNLELAVEESYISSVTAAKPYLTEWFSVLPSLATIASLQIFASEQYELYEHMLIDTLRVRGFVVRRSRSSITTWINPQTMSNCPGHRPTHEIVADGSFDASSFCRMG